MRKYKDYAVSFVLFASELVKDVSLLFEKEKAYFASAFFFFFFAIAYYHFANANGKKAILCRHFLVKAKKYLNCKD